MKFISGFAAVLSCVVLFGCAGTEIDVKSAYTPVANQKFTYEIIDEEKIALRGANKILREMITSQLVNANMLARSSDTATRSAQIVIDHYFMRHGAARALGRGFTGTDHILSTVVVKDAKTGASLSTFVVESKNPTATGSSAGLIEEHAIKIVDYLQTGQK